LTPIKNLFQKIITLLKNYQKEPLDGYFIAKIEVQKLRNVVLGINYKSVSGQVSSAIINEKISDFQLLTIILLKTEAKPIQQKSVEFKRENLLFEKRFTIDELINFLQISGDKNSIHNGENPVVPGLMIVGNILENLESNPDHFKIKFHNPLLLQNELKVFKITKNEMIGQANGLSIFQFIIN
jgi:hypothetical protein